MERAVEILAAIQFFIVGLSHMFQAGAWVEFFIWLRGRGYAGVFVHGFLSLGLGSLILAFHQVWSGIGVVLTVIGYLYTIKAFACFVLPSTQLRTLGRVSHERSHELVTVGVVYVVLAGLLAYSAWIT